MLKINLGSNSINPSEASAVQRSYQNLRDRKDIGFSQLPQDDQAMAKSRQMAKQILANFDHLVVIGIGGSSMGPRALAEITRSNHISFLDNVDSFETEKIISNLSNLAKTAWLMISKSGSTIEILCNIDLVAQIYEEKNIPFWPNTFYITEEANNPLRNLAKKYDRPSLEIPLNIGGRFSVLSPVGLVIAEYLKLNAEHILAGANQALTSSEDVIQCALAYLKSFERNENITLFWFYNSNMRWFGSWIQQLWAESLGKKETLDHKKALAYSTPMVSIGTCDQHSILQQVIEGPKNKFVHFFRFKNVENSKFTIKKSLFAETRIMQGLNYGELIKAEALATEEALQQSGVSTMSFELDALNENTLGFLFMFYQLVVATIGEHTNINAFDQPGVALGKKLTLERLKH